MNKELNLEYELPCKAVTTINIENLARTFAHADCEQQAIFFSIVGRCFKKFEGTLGGILGGEGQIQMIINGVSDNDSLLDDDGMYFLKLIVDNL